MNLADHLESPLDTQYSTYVLYCSVSKSLRMAISNDLICSVENHPEPGFLDFSQSNEVLKKAISKLELTTLLAHSKKITSFPEEKRRELAIILSEKMKQSGLFEKERCNTTLDCLYKK